MQIPQPATMKHARDAYTSDWVLVR